jgi:hypothetical protein
MGRRKIPMSERQHGVPNTYKAGCRCADCTSAASAYATERRNARKAVKGTPKSDHGRRSTYKAGCRCEKCTKAQSDYNAGLRAKAAEAAAATAGPPVLDELRIPVSCPNCGGAVVAQTESAVTGSGMRVTQMLRCLTNGCNRQWQFVGVLMSLNGAEYMGAA